jgi:hypothetical protein
MDRATDTGRRVFAWAVEVPGGFVALFLEHPRAVEYASRCHGVVVPLFDLREADQCSPHS